MMQRARKKALDQGGQAPAEVRLQGIWTGAILVPTGLLMWVDNQFASVVLMVVYFHSNQSDASVCAGYFE